MKIPDHPQGERALATEDFVDSGPVPDNSDQVATVLALLLEAEMDGFDGARQIDWIMLAFVGLDERGQNVKFVAFRGTLPAVP